MAAPCHELKDNRDAAIADYHKALEQPAANDHEKIAHAKAREGLIRLGTTPPAEAKKK
ncbi:MAG: hypothetical protein ACKVP7_01890 [Hyphomicrobiaceae bacterium]